jgi:3-oxoadipate enol-lactonase
MFFLFSSIGDMNMKITFQGKQFGYTDLGQGLPIVFIHGYPLSRNMWDSQLEYLSKTYRPIALDLRGHGESQSIPGPYSMDMLADDCATLLDVLNITNPVVVCGLSMGGYVTMAFYRRYSQRVAGLIFAGTRSSADPLESQVNRGTWVQRDY